MTTADYEQGYGDDRFDHNVGSNLHCAICLNVFKDPVMCQNNEHCFCRPCITRHLTNFNNCPTCMEELTPETLSPVSRLFKQCWSELNIRCNFYNRGCHELVQLGDLEKHLVDCGFAPVKCSNEGCHVQINKRDQRHHECEICKFRKTKCHDCDEIKGGIEGMEKQITEMQIGLQQMSIQPHQIDVIKGQIIGIQQQLTTLPELAQDIGVMKDQIMAQQQQQQQLATLPKLTQEISEVNMLKKQITEINQHIATLLTHLVPGAQMAEVKEGIVKSSVVVAGGKSNISARLNSAEVFDNSTASWMPLQPMNKCRSGASSFFFQNQMFITGGYTGNDRLDTMESLQVNSVLHSNSWVDFPGKLPTKLAGHRSVVYNERLIVIGGHDGSKVVDGIYEVLLVPPYTTKLLTRMPQEKWLHGAELVDDDIFILGGTINRLQFDNVCEVIKYDIVKNECNIMSPLPYAVARMATARWGDNVVVMGGEDKDGEVLNTVIIYNVKTGNSHMLPNMKYKRRGCVAVNVRNSIIVIGGMDKKNYLKEVEKFNFESYSWES